MTIWALAPTLMLALTLPGAEPSAAPGDVKDRARKACVRITDAAGTQSGSGVVVAHRDGFLYVLTASHVVAGAKDLRVVTYSADDRSKPGAALTDVDVLVQAADADFALIRVPAGANPPKPLRLLPPGSKLPTGAFAATTVGGDLAGVPECLPDRVLGKKLLRRPEGGTVFVWEAEAKPAKGRSGGALLDDQGRVIGVCVGTQDGKGYYSHLDEIHAALKPRKFDWLWQTAKE